MSPQLFICGTLFSLFPPVVNVLKNIQMCSIPFPAPPLPPPKISVSKSGFCAAEGGSKKLFFEEEGAQKEASLKLNLGGGCLANRL